MLHHNQQVLSCLLGSCCVPCLVGVVCGWHQSQQPGSLKNKELLPLVYTDTQQTFTHSQTSQSDLLIIQYILHNKGLFDTILIVIPCSKSSHSNIFYVSQDEKLSSNGAITWL